MTNLEIITTVMAVNKINEELHTFKRWQQLGFRIKKGEHGIETRLWKYNPKVAEKSSSDSDDEEDKKMYGSGFYLAKSYLFKQSQVERIVENVTE